MKKMWIAAAMASALPFAAQAQSLQPGGFYIGAEGGLNWLLNTTSTSNVTAGGFAGSFNSNLTNNLGWTAGGMIGYDFIGPRVRTRVPLHPKQRNPERPRRQYLGWLHGQPSPDHG